MKPQTIRPQLHSGKSNVLQYFANMRHNSVATNNQHDQLIKVPKNKEGTRPWSFVGEGKGNGHAVSIYTKGT